MEFPEAYRCFDEGHQWACASTHDGRVICGRCGYAESVTHDEYEHDEGDRERCGCGDDECPECNSDCWYCGGEGWGISGDDWPVDDPVNDAEGEVERCPNCRGSGKAKDCWFW